MNRKERLKIQRTPDASTIQGRSIRTGLFNEASNKIAADDTFEIVPEETIILPTPVPKSKARKIVDPFIQPRLLEGTGERNRFWWYPTVAMNYGTNILIVLILILAFLFWRPMFTVPRDQTLNQKVDSSKISANQLRAEFVQVFESYKELASSIKASQVKHVPQISDCAKIIHGTSVFVDDKNSLYTHGFLGFRKHKDPNIILLDNICPGDCLAFKGSAGRLTIQLDRPRTITKLGLFHPKTNDVTSAVENFEVIGFLKDQEVPLGSFMYETDSLQYQEFNIPTTVVDKIDILVKSNHGHARYTTIYKVSVYEINE